MGDEIKLFKGDGMTKDQCKLFNYIKLFLAGVFKDETQYLGATYGEERPTDLKHFSESGDLHKILTSGFSAQMIELLTSKSNKDNTIPDILDREINRVSRRSSLHSA
jgi:hypothetical protein